jgi:predicted lipoprotein with Yx(FWY)xxD motif
MEAPVNPPTPRTTFSLQQIVGKVVALFTLFTPIVVGTAFAQTQTTVQITDSALGDILVGPNGMTLYTFANDEPGASSCTGGCAINWPPLAFTGELVSPPGLPGELDTIVRPPDEETGERILQVTYNGQPLYYWSRDEAPGDTTGQGIGDLWLVAKP